MSSQYSMSSFSDSQSSQDFSQSLGSQNSYGSQSLETWDVSYEARLLTIVVFLHSHHCLLVSQAIHKVAALVMTLSNCFFFFFNNIVYIYGISRKNFSSDLD